MKHNLKVGAGCCMGELQKLGGSDVCGRPTDVGSKRLRPTSPRRLLQWSSRFYFVTTSVPCRPHRDQCMTSSLRRIFWPAANKSEQKIFLSCCVHNYVNYTVRLLGSLH